jgi:hypothetical protein
MQVSPTASAAVPGATQREVEESQSRPVEQRASGASSLQVAPTPAVAWQTPSRGRPSEVNG